jgi:hypothetical protein
MTNISCSSINVSTGKPFEASGIFAYACTGDSRQTVRISTSWHIGNVGQLDDGAGHTLLYNRFSDESHATVWRSWFGKVKAPTIDVPIGRSEKATGSVTVFTQLNSGHQGVPPGTYGATVGRGHVSFDYDTVDKGPCDASEHSMPISRVSFTVNAIVTSPYFRPSRLLHRSPHSSHGAT